MNRDDILNYYMQNATHVPMTKTDELKLFFRYKDGDMTARDTLIQNNLFFVVKTAKKYVSVNSAIDLLDLIQEGNYGLMLALTRYNPKYNTSFTVYATCWIRFIIKRILVKEGKNDEKAGCISKGN